MLRNKLLINLVPLVCVLVGTGVGAVWLLQHVLSGLNQASSGTGNAAQLHAVAREFQWVVLGLAVAFVAIINVSILVLLRLAGMILRPIGKLLAATHLLALEHFETRIPVDGDDEFNQLARAYNSLAERMESNERRRIETLQQVAVALNHELNNCVSIIDLQIRMVSRHSPACPSVEKNLRQMDESLRRMSAAVQSLKNVRRIVLTDYLPGTKMLDLQRSVEAEPLPDEATDPAHT